MTRLSKIIELLQKWDEDVSVDEAFTAFINFAVEDAEGRIDWAELKKKTTVTPDSDGVLLIPALCRKITGIYTTVATGSTYASHEFIEREKAITGDSGGVLRYVYEPYEASGAALWSGAVSCTDSATVTGSGFSSSLVGHRIMFDGSSQMYEVLTVTGTTSITLDRAFYGTATVGQVRPVGMLQLLLKTDAGAAYTSDVVVHYQKKHPELNDDDDMLLIPCAKTVSLLALQNALITNKYSVDARHLDRVLEQARSTEIGTSPFAKSRERRRDSTFAVRSRR